MTQALITIVAPLPTDLVEVAATMIEALGDPAIAPVAGALDRLEGEDGTHFVSLHAVRSYDRVRAWLMLECSADGEHAAALRRLIARIGTRLQPVFALASDYRPGQSFEAYLRRHQVVVGAGWFAHQGVVFVGTAGLSVGQIRAQADLAGRVRNQLRQPPPGRSALEILTQLRGQFGGHPALLPAAASPPWQRQSGARLAVGLIASFARTFLWPLALIPPLGAVLAALTASTGVWTGLAIGGVIAIVVPFIVAAAGYVLLRRAEASDPVDERVVDRVVNAEMFARESRCAQNHMISVTQRKPGLVRQLTLRLAFWAFGELVPLVCKPGFLGDVGTIHFARFVVPPGSPDLLFVSNYGGSWESYLEDFITSAHYGMTGVWSNCIGFPRSKNLVQKGAADGERFKRYARHSMQPTRFWYSAYPTLTTAEIRTNTAISSGLASATTEDAARLWLAQFASCARPPATLASHEIQSLVFGGLSFLPHGVCMVMSLPPTLHQARAWLRDISPHIAFDDGRRLGAPAVITLALGAPGLAQLGLPDAGLQSFPFTFLEGMVTESRARMLGDVGENAHATWSWGRTQPDAALLVYGKTAKAVADLCTELARIAARHNADLEHEIALKEVTADKREPFGFVDGISQPLIRGTYKAQHSRDQLNLVEPGEFILGYPDNRGNLPPGPTLPARDDPANLLPLCDQAEDAPRDLGCNGSFLVIRQLAQNRAALDAYCQHQAQSLQGCLPPPYNVTPEFIAAKLVGRWRDGFSLLRAHYQSPAHGRPDNDFRLGAEDPQALQCPIGSHMRRANPRDSLDPGSAAQISITNRHRIIRLGRQYEPTENQNPGLLFMCLNGDIERQFEFVQQNWLLSPTFHGLSGEPDALLGRGALTIPTPYGPIRLDPTPQLITTRGGGYFFLPGKRLVQYLSG